MEDVRQLLRRLDGRSYRAYRDLRGHTYIVGDYAVRFDHVQGDPFASPSRLSVDVPSAVPSLPAAALANPTARRATADFLQRAIARELRRATTRTGSGKSGMLEIAGLGQEVLERTAVGVAADGNVIVRLSAGLPAAGRRILGHEAAELVGDRLVSAMNGAVSCSALDSAALLGHVEVVEDQVAMRSGLPAQGLIAFLAEGSVLGRRSGADDRPMSDAIPLQVPDALRCLLQTPHAGQVAGLGIRRGVTLIVGGGYHGKSTLLDALARGVYDHVPGDGRERCVTVDGAAMIRDEDGRSVRGVDLRPFISRLPLRRATDCFDTEDASGSTSQAAAIIEALEAGVEAFLVDEDTAATNFMIRDARMRRLIPADKEPITPFLDRVRQLYEQRGVSSVLVVGGAGDYLDVADTVIQMDEYRPLDVKQRAAEVVRELPLGDAAPRDAGAWPTAAARIPDPCSLDPRRGRRAERVRSVRTRTIEFGSDEIDVSLLAQLVDPAQCRMVGDVLLALSRGLCDGRRSMTELLDLIEARIEKEGLSSIVEPEFGDRARARRLEIAAALNRLRSLRLK
jgi:predicted ABC-class ATPase